MKKHLAIAVVFLALAACGGGGDDESADATTTTEPTPATTATTVFEPEKAKADITTLYATFFNENTPTDEAVKLLEKGEELRGAIEEQRVSGAAKGISTKITSIQFRDPAIADVKFDILLKGEVVAPNTAGEAKWLDGRWKINKQLFCTLVGLAGQNPPACAS
jgi:hypothetical protein